MARINIGPVFPIWEMQQAIHNGKCSHSYSKRTIIIIVIDKRNIIDRLHSTTNTPCTTRFGCHSNMLRGHINGFAGYSNMLGGHRHGFIGHIYLFGVHIVS